MKEQTQTSSDPKSQGYPWYYPFKGITVTVLEEMKHGKRSYRVRWNLADGHEDKCFRTSGKAKDFARHKAIDLANNWLPSKEELAQLRQKGCLFDQCMKVVQPYNWDPVRAAYAMCDLLKHMGEEGVGKYLAVYGPKLARVIPHTVTEVRDKYLDYLTERNEVSSKHIANLKSCFSEFIDEFDGEVLHAIPSTQIEDWLLNTDLNGTTRNKWIYGIRRMFQFAQNKLKALPHGIVTEAHLVQRIKCESAEPEVFTVPELERVAAELPDKETILALVLVLFGHLRPKEASQLCAEHFRRAEDGTPYEIVVPKKIAKGKKGKRKGRTIPIRPNLAQVLKLTLPEAGPLFKTKDVYGRIRRVARAVGIEWKHNALRHCCDSYAVAAGMSKPAVAKWSGHTEAVQDEHYLVPVPQTEAKKYWRLTFDCQRIACLPVHQKSKLEQPPRETAEPELESAVEPNQLGLFEAGHVTQKEAA